MYQGIYNKSEKKVCVSCGKGEVSSAFANVCSEFCRLFLTYGTYGEDGKMSLSCSGKRHLSDYEAKQGGGTIV